MLPHELLRPIIEEIQDRPTLYALSLSSRALHLESQRILYRSISLQDRSNFRLHLYFLTTINQNPQLSLYVREYHSYSIIDYHENPGWNLLKQGLEKMINLKELSFRAVGGHPSCDLLENCTFQLDRLTWSNQWDVAMTPFLAGQPLLTYLDINCTLETEFPANVCPDLKELKGNINSLNALLPGRSITTVDWTPTLFEEERIGISRLVANSHSPLKKLRTLTMRRPSQTYFSNITDHLQSIETLKIWSPSVAEVSIPSALECSLTTIQSQFMSIPISNFTQLRHCILTFSTETPDPSFVPFLFSTYHRLQIVDISRKVLNGRLWYQRWIHGTVCPHLIIPDQV
jgi:hypothetical protein